MMLSYTNSAASTPDARQLADDLTEAILPLGSLFSSQSDRQRLCRAIVQEAQKICRADAGCLYLRLPSQSSTLELAVQSYPSSYRQNPNLQPPRLQLNAAVRTAIGEEEDKEKQGELDSFSLAAQAIQLGQPLHVADLSQQARGYAAIRALDAAWNYETLSCLTIPLKVSEGKAIAVLQLFNAKDAQDQVVPFSDYRQQLMQWFAAQAASALRNCLLLSQQADLLKSERDLQIGRQIQLDFLPETLPVIEGWEIAACFHPAREVAGDFYDAFAMPNGRVGVVIADVCDKGVGAALFMSLFRTLIRTLARQTYSLSLLDQITDSSPTKPSTTRRAGQNKRLRLPKTGTQALQNAITITNNYIAETHFRTSMFATLFFGVLDPATGNMIYINGGHEAPIVVGPQGIRTRLEPTGPAVGMMPNMDFQIEQVSLAPGEMLVGYTDGVPEAHSPSGEMFSDEALLMLLEHQQNSQPPAQLVLDQIERAVRSHIADAAQFDDITMIAVQRKRQEEAEDQ